MGDGTVLLVTGVANHWGSRLAKRLLEEDGVEIIGIDRVAPTNEIPGLDFIAADCQNPLLAELLRAESVSALCHLDFKAVIESDEKVGQRNLSAMTDVLNASAEANVQRIVVMSSTAVYGARPDNSTFLSEMSPLRANKAYGYLRDLLELEALCKEYRDQHFNSTLTVLRFANIVGSRAITPMTQFLSLQTPPILFGFDPMMQLVHEDDVIEALAQAMLNDRPGAFNVAAEDAMPLSRVLRLARRVPMPILHPLAYRVTTVLSGAGLEPERFVPIEWDYLRYSMVTDLSRMQEKLGFRPVYSAAASLREFASMLQADEGDDSGRLAVDEQYMRDIIDRRRRQRERRAST